MHRISRILPSATLLAACAAFLTPVAVPSAAAHEHDDAKPAANVESKATAPNEAAGHSHERASLHGGTVAVTKEHHFETVFAADGVRIYLYSRDQAPLEVEDARGTAKLRYQDGTKLEAKFAREMPAKGETTVYFCPMHPEVVQMQPGKCPACGGMTLYTQDRLFAKADLASLAPGSMKVVVAITGLGGPEPKADFIETFPGLEPAKAAAGKKADPSH